MAKPAASTPAPLVALRKVFASKGAGSSIVDVEGGRLEGSEVEDVMGRVSAWVVCAVGEDGVALCGFWW